MIHKIFRIKPLIFLIIIFAIQILAFLISIGYISIFDTNSLSLNETVFFTLNIIPILVWYSYTGYALFLKDKNENRKKTFFKFEMSVLLIFTSLLFSLMLESYKSSLNTDIRISIGIVLGILEIIPTIYILHYWVKGFVSSSDKRTVTKSDYLNYIYLMCIPPIGIYAIQKLINTIAEKEVQN